MPYSINGIGTSVCGGRGYAEPRLDKPAKWYAKVLSGRNFDGMECFVFFFIPLIPLKPIHAYNWNGTAYNFIPIRWSPALVAKVFLKRWIWIISALTAIILMDKLPQTVLMGLDAVLLAACLFLFPFLDRRDQAIRKILGPHQYGSSDPATWTEKLLKAMPPTAELYKKSTYGDAVPTFLAMGQISEAMWAARLSTAVENRPEGEKLTNTILADPHVQEALEKLKKEPENWKSLMGVKG